MSAHSFRYLSAEKRRSPLPNLSQQVSQTSLGTTIAQHLRRDDFQGYVAIWEYEDGSRLLLSRFWLGLSITLVIMSLLLIGAALYHLIHKRKAAKAARRSGDTEKEAPIASPGSPAADARAPSIAATGTRAPSMAAPGTRAASMAAPGTGAPGTRAPSMAAPGTRAASMAVPDAAAAAAADATDDVKADPEVPTEQADAIPPATRTASIAPV